MAPITELSFIEKSALFARLSAVAYLEPSEAKKSARSLGFTTTEFYNRDGAQAYRFQNKHDLVIACRGTQPAEFGDIKADLQAMPVVPKHRVPCCGPCRQLPPRHRFESRSTKLTSLLRPRAEANQESSKRYLTESFHRSNSHSTTLSS